MEYGIVRKINLHRPKQDRLLEDSKLKASKGQKPKDRRLDQPIKLEHYCTTQCMHYQTQKRKYWLFYGIFLKFYNSWDFYEYLVIKILQFLGLLQISCYLEIILKVCEISGDLKKILETWQHWMCPLSCFRKFNSAQLLFEAFFDIIGIFGTGQP